MEQERNDGARTCRELAAAGLVVGTSGNVSVRAGDLIAVSPSGLDYADLTAGLVGVHRPDGAAGGAPERTACLMATPGAVTTGPGLRSALTGTRYLEWLCEVYLRALAAAPSTAGQATGPRPLAADAATPRAGQL